MPDTRPSEAPEGRNEPQRLSDHLKEYLREPMLWPVAMVAVAIALTLGIAALLAAFERNGFALAALALLVGMSVDQVWRELRGKGAGWVTGLVSAFWISSALGAVLVSRSGLF